MTDSEQVRRSCDSNVEIWTGCSGGNNWCGTSVEIQIVWTGVSGNWCLWCVVEVGCAVEGRGRFVRGVCGN